MLSLNRRHLLLIAFLGSVRSDDPNSQIADEYYPAIDAALPSISKYGFKEGVDKGFPGFGARYTLSHSSGDHILFMHPPDICQVVRLCNMDAANNLAKCEAKVVTINNILQTIEVKENNNNPITTRFHGGYVWFSYVNNKWSLKFHKIGEKKIDPYCNSAPGVSDDEQCKLVGDEDFSMGQTDSWQDILITTSSPYCIARLSPVGGPVSTGSSLFKASNTLNEVFGAYVHDGRTAPTPIIMPKTLTSDTGNGKCPSVYEMPFFTREWSVRKNITELKYQIGISTKCSVDTARDSYKYSFVLELVPLECDWVRICIGESCTKINPTHSIDLLFKNHLYIPMDNDEARPFGVELSSLHSIRFRIIDDTMIQMGYPVQGEQEYITEFFGHGMKKKLRYTSNDDDKHDFYLMRAPYCQARLVTDGIEENWVDQSTASNCLFFKGCSIQVEK